MKKAKLPNTDSIQDLAKFWASHDLTDFQDDLEEVKEPVFVRDTAIRLHLEPREAKMVAQMARAKGVSEEELVRDWVLQKLTRRSGARGRDNRAS